MARCRFRLVPIALAILTPFPVPAQDSSRAHEIYHIFDIKTSAPRKDIIKALQDGMNKNISNSNTITPIVPGGPPEEPGRFTLVNPFQNSPLAGFLGSTNTAMVKQARCDGAVWISSAVRRVRGGQQLNLTLCLFPYREGYNLDIHGIDVQERGGGISARLGRAMAQAIVGDMDGWTNKTILDIVRSVREATQAKISYVEGQPEIQGTPWEEGRQLPLSTGDRTATDEPPRP